MKKTICENGVWYEIEESRNLIPEPTEEQLKASGMKKRDDRPVECKKDDVIWSGQFHRKIMIKDFEIGKFKWVLVPVEKVKHSSCIECDLADAEPVPRDCIMCSRNESAEHYNWRAKVEKEPAHTSCATCRYKADNGSFNITSAMCGNCFNYEKINHSNYTPAPAPAPEPKHDVRGMLRCGECFSPHHDRHNRICDDETCKGYSNFMPKQPAPMITSKPAIVCLCGSTRFSEAFRAANFRETLAGKIVLSIGCDFKSDDALNLTADDKIRLDELHKRKIDLADEVLILNVGGYIGNSTRSELEYAKSRGKTLRYLKPIQPSIWPTLEEYLRNSINENIIDFAIRTERTEDDRIVFYIHPLSISGETADFEVHENGLEHNKNVNRGGS